MSVEARDYRVCGLVQGVGFRPTVYRIAAAANLSGYVFNDPEGVGVHLEGEESALDDFPRLLTQGKPPLARIDSISFSQAEFKGCRGFQIVESRSSGKVKTAITADASICLECMKETLNPFSRRYRYAFTNCTHCGPRFTITRSLPYDRPQTSMALFPLCGRCRSEYEDPLDRRFHAQPVACPVCGPRLQMLDAVGSPVSGDPIELAAQALLRGEIVAIKGIGGFHLAVDATNEQAVQRLRTRKKRREKPLAAMGFSIASLKRFARITEREADALQSPAHPIVLSRKLEGSPVAPSVAPGTCDIGLMLAYTPLHYALFDELMGRPSMKLKEAGASSEEIDAALEESFRSEAAPFLLVMTSANSSGDPLVIDNDDAVEKLSGIADCFLVHDRAILLRCDDSVVRFEGEDMTFVRRARGYAPEAILVDGVDKRAAAMGAYLKNAPSLSRPGEIVPAPHVGDLDNLAQEQALRSSIEHLEGILEAEPELVVVDLHKDYPSTRIGEEAARSRGLPILRVQHHAAHIAAVMAERSIKEPVLGIALDGTGLGTDGSVWGAEVLAVGPEGFKRAGSLEPLPLLGGDKAAREPWRCALAVLHELGLESLAEKFFPLGHPKRPLVEPSLKLLSSSLAGRASSMGRLFDAAAFFTCGITQVSDEGTAPMALEEAAELSPDAEIHEDCFEVFEENGLKRLSWRPIMKALLKDLEEFGPQKAAMSFQKTMGDCFARFAAMLWSECMEPGSPRRIALSGGSFVNRTLYAAVRSRLESLGFEALNQARSPVGDGGLSVGQAWIAQIYEMKSQDEQYPQL